MTPLSRKHRLFSQALPDKQGKPGRAHDGPARMGKHAGLAMYASGEATYAVCDDKGPRSILLEPLFCSRPTDRMVIGRFIAADSVAITVRDLDRDEIIARERVKRILIEKHGRRWYSIPLAGAAAGAGIAAGLAISNKASCSNGTDTCSRARGILAFAIPAAAAILTYKATPGTSWKVIYEASK